MEIIKVKGHDPNYVHSRWLLSINT